jgi:starvation-inducible DNA-binding protein
MSRFRICRRCLRARSLAHRIDTPANGIKMHPTRNTLPEAVRLKTIDVLGKHLAAAIDLHAQMKQAHWNVRGPTFIAIHELFDRVSTEVEAHSDLIAERIGALGGTAAGGIKVVFEQSYLVPYTLGVADAQQHVFAVAGALAGFGGAVREAIATVAAADDAVTADMLTEVLRGIDQQLWFVESHAVHK